MRTYETVPKLYIIYTLHPETDQGLIWQVVAEVMMLLLIGEGKVFRLLDLFVVEEDVAFSFFPLSLALRPSVPYWLQSSA